MACALLADALVAHVDFAFEELIVVTVSHDLEVHVGVVVQHGDHVRNGVLSSRSGHALEEGVVDTGVFDALLGRGVVRQVA